MKSEHTQSEKQIQPPALARLRSGNLVLTFTHVKQCTELFSRYPQLAWKTPEPHRTNTFLLKT